jgi:hypothetical protein
MLLRLMLTGSVLALTTAAALAYGTYDGTYRGKLIGISNHAPSCSKTDPVRMGRITGHAIQAETGVGNGCSYQLILKQFP